MREGAMADQRDISQSAIDLGLKDPPVIIEAKVIQQGKWAHAIREASASCTSTGTSQVVSPQSSLIFLASEQVPGLWLDYLDQNREIGAAWRSGDGFELTDRARSTCILKQK